MPDLRIGADLDLISTQSTRLGLDMDICPNRPFFVSATSSLGLEADVDPRLRTAGIHLAYNSPDCGTLGWSFEGRARREISVKNTKITELDLAIGVKSPETVLGTLSLRGGWRYSNILLINKPHETKIHLSAWLGDSYILLTDP